jgi:hypothetical protein
MVNYNNQLFFAENSTSNAGIGAYSSVQFASLKLNAARNAFDYTIYMSAQKRGTSTSVDIYGLAIDIKKVNADSSTTPTGDIIINGTRQSLPYYPDIDASPYTTQTSDFNLTFEGSIPYVSGETITLNIYLRCYCRTNSGYTNAPTEYSTTFKISPFSEGINVGSKTTNAILILPPPTSGSSPSPLYLAKRRSGGGSLYIMTSKDIYIDNTIESAINLESRGCCSLFTCNGKWYTASYYKGTIRSYDVLVSSFNMGATPYAELDKVNIYTANVNTPRSIQNNYCVLPNPSAGRFCFVVYDGNAPKGFSNYLLFIPPVGSSIDDSTKDIGLYYSIPYIGCDGNQKSTGIVFVSDGVDWFIVGFMKTEGVSYFTDGVAPTPYKANIVLDNTSIHTNIFLLPTSNTGSQPIIVSTNFDASRESEFLNKSPLLIFKSQSTAYTDYGPRIYADWDRTYGTPNMQSIVCNNGVKSIQNINNDSNYECIWYVCYTYKFSGAYTSILFPILLSSAGF